MTDVHDFPLFRDLSPEGFKELVKAMSFRDLGDGEVLFRQGDTAEYVYVIRSGGVRIVASNDGLEEVYTQLGTGDLFGEMGAVRQLPRTATATGVGPTRLILFEATRFTRLMGEHPSIAGLVLRTMRGRFRMDDERAEARRKRHGGDVIALFSASGGAGTSTVAAGLAQALSGGPDKVLLVDLDLMFGDQRERFGLEGGPTLSDLVMSHGAEAPPDVIQRTLAGVDVLCAPARANHAEFVDARAVSRLISELRPRYKYILVDTSRRVEDFTLDLLDTAEAALYVLTADPLTQVHARRWRDLVRQVGLETDHVHAVANRISPERPAVGVVEKLGFARLTSLPDDPVGATAVGGRSKEAPTSPLVTALGELAAQLTAEDAPVSKPAGTNWGGGV